MKKIAWPWIGSTEHEMGSGSEAFKDVDQSAYTDYDSLVPQKSLYEGAPPSTEYSEGRISPVDGDGSEMILEGNAEDEEGELRVTVYEEGKKKASFNCNVAKTVEDKVMGLQSYSSLSPESGLLFKYSQPQDLLYHMGTVKFPIDIIFLDSNQVIKKIYSNIKPGSLATFGCANAQYVLEISGGLSDKLNISQGDNIEFDNFNIKKSASKKKEVSASKVIYAYNFDGIISRNSSIRVYDVLKYNEENITTDIKNNVFTPGDSRLVSVASLGSLKGERYSKTMSGMKDFLENSKETHEAYLDLKEAFANNNMIVFSTKYDSSEEVAAAFLGKLEVLYGPLDKKAFVVCKIDKDYNHLNLIEDLREIYPKSEIRLFADSALTKNAGTPISTSTKESAKKVLAHLSSASNLLKKSMDNISQNLTEYENIRNEDQKIKSTQGQYHQSAKRNIDIAKKYLTEIKNSIKILNKIKDSTTTMEIIESLASASQNVSESIQEVFNLITKINTPDFIMLLGEASHNYEKAAEDLQASIERAKDYINRDILGIIVLST